MRRRTTLPNRLAPLALALALGASLGACGGSSEQADAPPPPARPEDFPKAEGKTLAQLQSEVGDGGPVLVPSVSEVKAGRNRFGFGLFDRSRAQIADAPVAVYVAPRGGGPARGPFPARYESLAVKTQFQSKTVASDPDAAKSLYVADVPLPRDGAYNVLGVARLDDRLVAATPARPAAQGRLEAPVAGRGRQGAADSTARPPAKPAAMPTRSTPESRPRPCTRSTSPTWWARSR